MVSDRNINYVPEGSLKLRWKMVVLSLVLLASLEAWVIKIQIGMTTPRRIYPQAFSFYRDNESRPDDYVSVKGSWMADQKQYIPIQVSSIRCFKKLAFCSEASAYIEGDSLTVQAENHGLIHWDNDSIVFTSQDQCVHSETRINLLAKTVIRTLVWSDSKACQDGNPTVILQLVDGGKIWRQLNDLPQL